MTAPNTKKPPTDVYFVTTGADSGVYWKSGTVKSALKNSPQWRRVVHTEPYGRHTEPKPGLVILRSEIGSAEGWVDVTEEFVKDGKWAW